METIKSFFQNFWVKVATLVGVLLVGLFFYWIFWLNHLDINEIGVAYNSLDGKITEQEVPGWYVTHPFVKVAYISTLPRRVEIPSSARVIVAKIVRFNPKGLDEYIRLQGFGYDLNSSLDNVLLGYSFSGKDYPFLEVMQDVSQEDIEGLRPLKKGEPSKQ